jgi:hypothetical protein
MTDNDSSRRNFLKILGLSAGATMLSSETLGSFINREEIMRLNPEQQEFMTGYGKWMDDFIEVIRTQKQNPADRENQKRMIALTKTAEDFKPQLNEFMKDETFSVVYRASIERMSREI